MVCMPVSNEDENSDMELINTELPNVHNDTLMVPTAPKSKILIKQYDLIFAPSLD